MSKTRGHAVVTAAILLIAVVLAAGNVLCHTLVVRELSGLGFDFTAPGLAPRFMQAIREVYHRSPADFWFFAASPLVAGIVILLLARLRGRPAIVAETSPAASRDEAKPSSSDALRLLALLQQEGRLIDFLEENIDAYGDAQVGAAVRAIHAGCRKALHDRMQIERIFAEEDGSAIKVEPGFDPSRVRLTGDVHGKPPFHGTLQHGGWRASQVTLPASSDIDPTILAPAEVEITAGD